MLLKRLCLDSISNQDELEVFSLLSELEKEHRGNVHKIQRRQADSFWPDPLLIAPDISIIHPPVD
jgi:hypothetical protein